MNKIFSKKHKNNTSASQNLRFQKITLMSGLAFEFFETGVGRRLKPLRLEFFDFHAMFSFILRRKEIGFGTTY